MDALIARPLSTDIRMIEARVRRAEGTLRNGKVLGFSARNNVYTDWTRAPNGGQYASSPILDFGRFLIANRFLNDSACDLGGGLGGIGAAQKIFFKYVEVWEADRRLCRESTRIWKEAGEPYSEIKFHGEDFLVDADLGRFSFIYFFQPFTDEFGKLMGGKLLEAGRGAIVACHKFYRVDNELYDLLFPGHSFRQLGSGHRSPFPFDVFERI